MVWIPFVYLVKRLLIPSRPHLKSVIALLIPHKFTLVDAQISPYRRGEIPLAAKFIAQFPNNSITLFDKDFWSANLLLSLSMQGKGHHWLIPERKNLKGELIETYGEGDVRVSLKVSPQARKKNPTLPEYWEARKVNYAVRDRIIKTVLTSLPANHYSAEDIAALPGTLGNRTELSGYQKLDVA